MTSSLPDPVNEAIPTDGGGFAPGQEAGILSQPGVRDALFLLVLFVLIYVIAVFWTDLMVPSAWPNLIGPTE